MTTELNLNEFFTTFQGEGINTGRRATFIRFQGCPVNCSWCDTAKAIPVDGISETWKLSELMHAVREKNAPLVIITGGEPLYQDPDMLADIAYTLSTPVRDVWMETSGVGKMNDSLLQAIVVGALRVTWSPKSVVGYRANPKIASVTSEAKLVVDEYLTEAVVRKVADITPPCTPIYLMPEGFPPAKESYARTLALFNELSNSSFADRLRISPRLQFDYGVK